jgi:nucleoside diphosphate kinase
MNEGITDFNDDNGFNDTLESGELATTLAIIKPNAFGYSEDIKLIIREAGFTILQEKLLQLLPENAEMFYEEHRGKPFFEKLVNFMTSGPIRVMALARINAISKWREVIGPTNPTVALNQAPNR